LQGDIPFAKPVFEDHVDPKVVAKWQVWHDCSGISKEEAARQYIHLLMSYDPSWSPKPFSTSPASNATPPQVGVVETQVKRGPRQRRGKHSSAVASLTSGVAPKGDGAAASSPPQAQQQQQREQPQLSQLRNPSNEGAEDSSIARNRREWSQGSADTGRAASDSGGDGGSSRGGYESNGYSESNGVVEGVLFKQRDVFKGWRQRFFRLEDQVLNYYINNPADDPTPRNSILMVNCDITSVESSSSSSSSYPSSPNGSAHGSSTSASNGRSLYPFVISHPASSKTYKLAAMDIPTRDRWISALRRAAGTHNQTSPSAGTTLSAAVLPIESLSPTSSSEPSSADSDAAIGSSGGSNESYSDSGGVPPQQQRKIGSMLDRFMRMTSQPGPGPDGTWIPFGEKLGVQGFKLASSDKFVTVKGEGVVNHPVADVFRLLFDPVDKKSYDSQLDEGARLEIYNSQTVCDHLQLKAIWPTTARDFLSLAHWRVVSSDTIALIAFHIPAR
jgi:hypothetical protein